MKLNDRKVYFNTLINSYRPTSYYAIMEHLDKLIEQHGKVEGIVNANYQSKI